MRSKWSTSKVEESKKNRNDDARDGHEKRRADREQRGERRRRGEQAVATGEPRRVCAPFSKRLGQRAERAHADEAQSADGDASERRRRRDVAVADRAQGARDCDVTHASRRY